MPRPEPPAAARRHPVIPIRATDPPAADPASATAGGDCSGSEPFALRVLGDAMAPEFAHGDIVIIEPDGALRDGSFVLLQLPDEGWALRQLHRAPGDAAGRGWLASVLDGSSAPYPLGDLQAVAGVVIQRARPGRRRETRWYVGPTGSVA